MQGFPVSSSGSRTTIGDSLGSRTQVSVSYTHLDVYKRQVVCAAIRSVNASMKEGPCPSRARSSIAFETAYDAVSYTHLEPSRDEEDLCSEPDAIAEDGQQRHAHPGRERPADREQHARPGHRDNDCLLYTSRCV